MPRGQRGARVGRVMQQPDGATDPFRRLRGRRARDETHLAAVLAVNSRIALALPSRICMRGHEDLDLLAGLRLATSSGSSCASARLRLLLPGRRQSPAPADIERPSSDPWPRPNQCASPVNRHRNRPGKAAPIMTP